MTIFGCNIKIVVVFIFGYLLLIYGATNAVDATFYQNKDDVDLLDKAFILIGAIISLSLSPFLFGSMDKEVEQYIINNEIDNKKPEWRRQKEQINHFRKRYAELKKKRR